MTDLTAPELLDWLTAIAPADRDRALEERLGMDASSSPPGEHLVGYHASGVAPIVRMLVEVPVVAADVVVDLGAGLGKVLLLARLLTGATTRGIELQPALVVRAREIAARCGVDISMEEGDVRDAVLDDGTVFFLYLPFTGPILADVLRRLETIATHRPIVVCSLGLDLERQASWLARRPLDSFWLAIYDSVVEGVPARAPGRRASALDTFAELAGETAR